MVIQPYGVDLLFDISGLKNWKIQVSTKSHCFYIAGSLGPEMQSYYNISIFFDQEIGLLCFLFSSLFGNHVRLY